MAIQQGTRILKNIVSMVALVVFLLPTFTLAAPLQNVNVFSTTVNNQYKIEGFITGNMANNSNIKPDMSSFNMSGVTDGTMKLKATDLTGLNGNIAIGVVDGNKVIASGVGEVTVNISDLNNASNPVIRAGADAARFGDQTRSALDYSYPINVEDKKSVADPKPPVMDTLRSQKPLPFENTNPSFGPVARPEPDAESAENASASDPYYSNDSTATNKGLVPCKNNCTIQKIVTMGVNIYNYLTGFGAILAVAAIVYGGFSYITSQGDSSKMSAAKEIIISAIKGIVILAASALIVNTVINWVGVKNIDKVENINEGSVLK